MKYWKNIISFLFPVMLVLSLGVNAYFYFYKEDNLYKEKHEQLKVEFDLFKDSINIEFEILQEEREKNVDKITDIKSERDITKRKLIISNSNTKRLQDSIRLGEERKKLILKQLDTITNEDADIWTIKKFG